MTPTEISLGLAVKLGSLVAHVDELDPNDSLGFAFDLEAAKSLVVDPEVAEWIASFGPGLLPERRS